MTDATTNPNPTDDPRPQLPPEHADWAVSREEAIPRLLELEGGRLHGLSSRICGNAEEAEDLVQEVFLQAWRNWHQFRGDARPAVWLYTIARHTCERMHRKRSGEPAAMESIDELLPYDDPTVAVLPSAAHDDRGDALTQQIRTESKEQVEEAITALPVEFRMPLILKEIIGFSVQEVSEVLGLPTATVKTRLHRARLKVRRVLEKGLPRLPYPPPAYSRQVCLDLLDAKQEALDNGVVIESFDRALCDRCDALFATLDLATERIRVLGESGVLPAKLAQSLRESLKDAS